MQTKSRYLFSGQGLLPIGILELHLLADPAAKKLDILCLMAPHDSTPDSTSIKITQVLG